MNIKLLLLGASLPLLAASIETGAAAINVDGVTNYTQNFDTLPTGPARAEFNWTDDVTIPGFYLHRSNSPAAPQTNLAGTLATAASRPFIANGSVVATTAPNHHGFLSLGAFSSTERALGFCPTTTDGITNWSGGTLSIVALFTNNGATATDLTEITCDLEAWRANSAAANSETVSLTFKKGDAASLLADLATRTATATFTQTGYAAVDVAGGGNFDHTETDGFTALAAAVPPSVTRTGVLANPIRLAPGQSVILRWGNVNDGGADAQIGVDNLTVKFAGASAAVVATITNVVRDVNFTPLDPSDDNINFTLNVAGTGAVNPAGWEILAPAALASTGLYGVDKNFVVPVASFDPATYTLTGTVQDQGAPATNDTITLTAPRFVHPVTATNSPSITFTPSNVGEGSYVPPVSTASEPGWSGGTNGAATNSNVQTQPLPSTETLKYFHLTTNGTSFTTDSVDVTALKGALVQGEMELSFYSTSTSGFEPADVLNFRLEVARDGNFSNTAAGNIITANIRDVPANTAPAFGTSIAAGPDYINLGTAAGQTPFPATDFTLHKFASNVFIPAAAPNPHARIIAQSITGISNSEHLLIDNIVFRSNSNPAITTISGAPIWNNNNTVATADDSISVPVTITGHNAGASTGWTSNGTPASGSYTDPQPVIFTSLASAIPAIVTLTDDLTPAATASFTLNRPPAGTLTAALVGGSIVRNENGPGDADDTVTFDITVSSTNAGPAFTATANLLPVIVTGGTYPAGGTAVLTMSNLPNGAVTVNVVIADASYPAAPPAPVTIPVAVPASSAAPGTAVFGRKDFGAGLSDVGVVTQGPEWINYAGSRSMVMTTGGTDSVVETEVLNLSSVGEVTFTANLRARDSSTGSNFETGDRFKAELIIDGTTIVPLIPAALDVGNGANAIVAPGTNGPANGYLNGYSGTAGTDIVTAVVYAAVADNYNANRARDEFNTAGVNAAALMDALIPLSAIIPAGADSVQLKIYGAGVNGTESFTVQDVLFTAISTGSDSDGDGVSDPDEGIMGTIPNDANDVLRLTQNAGNPNQISFPTMNGRYYRVYFSDDANEASHLQVWKVAGLGTFFGDGNNANFTITVVPGETRRFYRVHVMQTDGPNNDGIWPATWP